MTASASIGDARLDELKFGFVQRKGRERLADGDTEGMFLLVVSRFGAAAQLSEEMKAPLRKRHWSHDA